jgi:hypothetical protein
MLFDVFKQIMYTLLCDLYFRHIGVPALRDQQGYLHSDSETKAHLLNMQFKSVYTKENLENIQNKGQLILVS